MKKKIKKIFFDIRSNPSPFVYGWLSGGIGLSSVFIVAGICNKFIIRTEQIEHSILIGIPIGIFVYFLLSLFIIHKYNHRIERRTFYEKGENIEQN